MPELLCLVAATSAAELSILLSRSAWTVDSAIQKVPIPSHLAQQLVQLQVPAVALATAAPQLQQ